jgi:CRISPR-associated protein Csd1
MLVQALAEYADTRLGSELEEEFWEEKPIPFFLELDNQGRFLASVPREMEVQRGKKAVKLSLPLGIPKSPVPRNAGVYPLLAVDDIKYVLGAGPWTAEGQEENNTERFAGFIELLRKAATVTEDESLLVCCRFYEHPEEVERARQAFAGKAKAGTNIALSVGGPVVSRTAVKNFWRDHFRSVSAARVAKGGLAECLVSGRIGEVAPTHEKIKGLANLGGQSTGVSLMSFDKEAFRSYGWEQCANSPVSQDRAGAYVLALNDLLRADSTGRRDIANIAFIFWTRKPVTANAMTDLFDPDPEHIQKLLNLDLKARELIEPNMFYMAGLAANGGRMLVRYWVAETLADTLHNVAAWYAGLRIINPFTGKSADFPRLWQLLTAIDREGDPPADRVLALLRRAIEGRSQPLGNRMIAAVLTRLRAEKDKRLDPVRHGLLRLCTNDLTKSGGALMSEELDDGVRERAYLCGRLLAVYEGLQETVYRSAKESKVNLTVGDRYYSLASVAPQVAFPKIVNLGKKHMAKLGRERAGLKVAIERDVARLCDLIKDPEHGEFPGNLSLIDQGRFALGYYHQRAADLNRRKTNVGAQAEAGTEEPELDGVEG